jgi:hypothetical protein
MDSFTNNKGKEKADDQVEDATVDQDDSMPGSLAELVRQSTPLPPLLQNTSGSSRSILPPIQAKWPSRWNTSLRRQQNSRVRVESWINGLSTSQSNAFTGPSELTERRSSPPQSKKEDIEEAASQQAPTVTSRDASSTIVPFKPTPSFADILKQGIAEEVREKAAPEKSPTGASHLASFTRTSYKPTANFADVLKEGLTETVRDQVAPEKSPVRTDPQAYSRAAPDASTSSQANAANQVPVEIRPDASSSDVQAPPRATSLTIPSASPQPLQNRRNCEEQDSAWEGVKRGRKNYNRKVMTSESPTSSSSSDSPRASPSTPVVPETEKAHGNKTSVGETHGDAVRANEAHTAEAPADKVDTEKSNTEEVHADEVHNDKTSANGANPDEAKADTPSKKIQVAPPPTPRYPRKCPHCVEEFPSKLQYHRHVKKCSRQVDRYKSRTKKWGAAQYITLGVSFIVAVPTAVRWRAAIKDSCGSATSLLVDSIVATARGYSGRLGIDVAPPAFFGWVARNLSELLTSGELLTSSRIPQQN